MLRRVRIPVQLALLAVFLYLLVRTVGVGEDRLGPPVRIFLDVDPLIGLTAWLRTGTWNGLMWLSAVTLLLAFLLGRSFCGWICPLGTLAQASGRLRRPRRAEKETDRFRRAQDIKVGMLVFVLGGALAGAQWSGILDPLCLLVRGLAIGFGPGLEWSVRGAAAVLARTPLGAVTEPIYRATRDSLLASHPPHFEQGTMLALLLVTVLALSWVIRRFWCRILCPLGALLGLTARIGALRLRQDESSCTSCEICTFHCQGAADPDIMGGWRASECFVCGNCTASCRRHGLAFTLERPRIIGMIGSLVRRSPRAAPRRSGSAGSATVDLTRRGFLASAILGLVSGPIARAAPARTIPRGSIIRPPGAGPEDEFLDRCIRCGECMKVCPANGLNPAGLEAGAAGLWAPILRTRLGYCEYHCTLCGQVCPTGAIPRLTPAEKERTYLGLAWVDTGRCLPYAFVTPCIVCEEHCPTSPKAIRLVEAEGRAPDGTVRQLRRPTVDPKLCVGCGVCEFVCPLSGTAAIRIEGIGRTRRENPFVSAF
jgi:polyferredoxin/formate hydrogenlyase subunit 6/NADH:ubiquinone oxidoreductase subunit I